MLFYVDNEQTTSLLKQRQVSLKSELKHCFLDNDPQSHTTEWVLAEPKQTSQERSPNDKSEWQKNMTAYIREM